MQGISILQRSKRSGQNDTCVKAKQLTGNVLRPEPEKTSVSHLDSNNFLMEKSLLNKMLVTPVLPSKAIPKMMPEACTFYVWQASMENDKFKAETSKQFLSYPVMGQNKINKRINKLTFGCDEK